MSLADDYTAQFAWRAWPAILDLLPAMAGQTVLDLGCAVGDQAAALVARGARVIGVDANDQLVEVARAKRLRDAEFRNADLRTLTDVGTQVDGIWCSFAAAYFPDFTGQLRTWAKLLRAGGWIAVTEIDDLFGHAPLSARTKSMLDGYAREALARVGTTSTWGASSPTICGVRGSP